MSRIRADKFVNRAATGAPELTYGAQVVTGYGITGAGGINITGVVTATGGWGGTLAISDTTDSTSSTTGALTVSGGVGIAKSLFVGNNVTIGGTLTYEDVTNVDSVGLITAQTGIKVTAGGIDITAGGLDVSAGIVTIANETAAAGGVDIDGGLDVAGISTLGGETRFTAVSEELARIDGNTANITWNSSGQNIGLCTNPTGDITLNVTGIPVDSNFNNQVLTFSVIVQQTGTARTCNAVKLNGVTKTVRWSGNVPGTAGVAGTIRGYDIFNFTGINTVGSATSAANYEVLGLVNGDFRTHA